MEMNLRSANNMLKCCVALSGFVLLALLPESGHGLDFTLPDVVDSVKSVGMGLANPSLLPTPLNLFEGSKQLIAGYPFEFVSTSINTICSTALSSRTLKSKVSPDINKMNFQLRTACNKYNYPLLKAEQMWQSPEFDAAKKVVILATGWTTTINDTDTVDQIAKAYHCRGNVNFVAVDAAKFVDTLYTWSAFNTEELGENIALGLVKLLEHVPVENIHLIGHSLGAHIMGAAARHLHQLTNRTLPRITGLDPAKPCFNEGEALSGLQRGDAKYIDIIHSNPGVLGKRNPLGDVDFYPGGLDPLPAGCLSVTCAHARAWQYYAESVYPGNENNFLSVRCGSLTRLRDSRCPGSQQPMGYAVPPDLRGNYFLEVNGRSPFGMQSSPIRESHLEPCGLCPKKS